MLLLLLAFQVAAILTLLWGAVLACGFVLPRVGVATVAAPWCVVTVFFAVETVVGLGSLRGLTTLALVLAAALIWLSGRSHWPSSSPAWVSAWRAEFGPRQVVRVAWPFAVAFFYALAWRYRSPDLTDWIEKIPDLAQVVGHAAGEGVPGFDAWYGPFRNSNYYAFQHYGAALLGRMLVMSPGLASNLGFCVMVGCIGAAFAGALAASGATRRVRVVIWVALLIGGSGVTLLAPWLIEGQRPWERIFLFGSVPMTVAPLGTWLESYAASFPRLSLPFEPLAYSILLGDFHAPLGSYALLGLAITAGAAWRESGQVRYAGLVGASITWTVLANPWALPLHGLAVCAWIVWERGAWKSLLPAVAVGGAVVWLAAWGFLAEFTVDAARHSLRFAWVPSVERTPPLFLLILLGPTLLLLLSGAVSGDRTARWLAVLGAGALLLLEGVYVDDSYTGSDNRFNTVLKAWPWVASALLLLLAPRLLSGSMRRGPRILAIVACVLPCAYAKDLWISWRDAGSPSSGRLEGHAFLTSRRENRILLDRLRQEPCGVVVQDPRADGEPALISLPLHAGHRMWLGWDGYASLWRGFPEDVPHRRRRLEAAFDGRDPAAGAWMAAEGIDYVLFFRPPDSAERWSLLDRALRGHYTWYEVFQEGDRPVGFWRRVPERR